MRRRTMASCGSGVDLTKKKVEERDGWTVELENSYRFQCAGYRNTQEYTSKHGSSMKFYKEGLIQKLRNFEDTEDCLFPNTRCLAALSSEQSTKALRGENIIFEGTKYEKRLERQKILQPLTISERNGPLEFVVFHGPNEKYTVVPLSYDLNPIIVAAQLFYESLAQTVQLKKTKNVYKRKNAEAKSAVWSQVYTCSPKNACGSEQSLVSDKSTVTYYSFRFMGSGKNKRLECTISCTAGPTKTVSVLVSELSSPRDVQNFSTFNLKHTISTPTELSSPVMCEPQNNMLPDATVVPRYNLRAIKKVTAHNIQVVDNVPVTRNRRMVGYESFSESPSLNKNIDNNTQRDMNLYDRNSEETEHVHRPIKNAEHFQRRHAMLDDMSYYSTSNYSRHQHPYSSKGSAHSEGSMRKNGNNSNSLKFARSFATEQQYEKQFYCSSSPGDAPDLFSTWPNDNNQNRMDFTEDNSRMHRKLQPQNTPQRMVHRTHFPSPSPYETKTQRCNTTCGTLQYLSTAQSILNDNSSSLANTPRQRQCSDTPYRDARMTPQFPIALQEEHQNALQERQLQHILHQSAPFHSGQMEAIYAQSPNVLQLRNAAERAQQWLQQEMPQTPSASYFPSVQCPIVSAHDFSPMQQFMLPTTGSPNYTGMYSHAQPENTVMHVDFLSQFSQCAVSQIQKETNYAVDRNYNANENPVPMNSSSGLYCNESLAEECFDMYSPNIERDWNSNPAVFGGCASSPLNACSNQKAVAHQGFNQQPLGVASPFHHLNESRISCDHLSEDLEGIRPLNWDDPNV